MRTPYWTDDTAALYIGDAREVLAEMPDRSVDAIVTSPPYWGKRDYGVSGQYGLEDSPEAYVAHLRGVFAEARRVLADDGTCWVNLGDCYAGSWGNYVADGSRRSRQAGDASRVARYGTFQPPQARLRPKNLLGLPWRVAFALQEDGWLLRSAVVWHKPNAMPESVRDRLSARYELVFFLTKSSRHWFDSDAARAACAGDQPPPRSVYRGGNSGRVLDGAERCRPSQRHVTATGTTGVRHAAASPTGRTPGKSECREVWSIPTRPFRGAHFAVFPLDVPLRCIAAGCRPGGVVCDPFAGTATTGLAARCLGRAFLGVELNPAYADLAVERLTRDRAQARQEPR